ncbi:hypothetical protein CP532_3186 [Ophiocordyceps camponoti-leonardi (nom. inval.)]|nr:hypothetical protein CP532_3186 [Ophiocordyceps camponoti-leonardi (nom. inval.)]
MADIDDELLALAGGDSEDEGSARDASASPGRTETAKNAKRRGSGDEEEATSLPGTPNSLESAPMDESDSDAEQPAPRNGGEGGDQKYPVDGMFASQAEKAEIMALREVEREQIIAERISEIERQRQNRLLRQMVTSVENEERKHVKKKRSADAADLDDGDRLASRQRTGKASETAMDSLRRAKAEKQRRKEDQDRRKDAPSPRRDTAGQPEGDHDFDRVRSRTPQDDGEAKGLPPPELHDYDRVRVGRNEFAQVCSTPGFEAAITGCFIRLAVGMHPDTGIPQYRMACIKGFATGKPYAMSGPNGQFVTDQYVRAAHGKAIREFPFIATSSSKLTDAELNRYVITCRNEGVSLPTKQSLVDKIDDINALINHSWTSEEIKARLTRRNELKRQFDPLQRERLGRLLDEAVARGEENKVEELQQELAELSGHRLAFRTTLGATRGGETAKSSEQDRLAERNRENRRLNVEQVRRAQLKEKAKTRGGGGGDDGTRRLRVKSAKSAEEQGQQGQQSQQQGQQQQQQQQQQQSSVAESETKQMASHLAKLQEKKHGDGKGLPTIHKPLMDDEVIGALDLGIDVEI